MKQQTETSLWQEHLDVLKASLSMGKPDAIRNIKAEIQRLHAEMVALMSRATIQVNAQQDSSRLTALAEETKFRIGDLSTLLRDLRLIPKDQDHGPTPEVQARPAARDPIVLLEEAERRAPGTGLTADQARAAKEIAWVSEGITRAGQARVARMTAAGRALGYREPEMPANVAECHATRYLPWADYLHRTNPRSLDICVKVAVHGTSLKALARKHRKRWSFVLDNLRRGLDRYWDRNLLSAHLDGVDVAKRERSAS